MSTLLVWKEQLQQLYSKYAGYINKGLQFILGLSVFGLINSNVGYMEIASSAVCTLGLSVLCTFLPLTVMVVFASALILAHFYTLSMPVALVAAAIFLIMYIFYFRFTPKKAWLVLLTPLAFALKVPCVIPIAFGLIGTPVYILPVTCGTMVYYMISYVKTSATALKGSGAEGMVTSLTTFTKQVLQNKEMWLAVTALAVCLLMVYFVRTKSADHSWKIGIVAGAVTNIIIMIIGDVTLNLHVSYVWLILGSVLAIVIGIVLEFLVFSLDYSRTERMQFEDDEYYYYVKAVPKVMVSAPEKTVKRINERQDTTMIRSDDLRGAAEKHRVPRRQAGSGNGRVPSWSHEKTEEELLKKSLDRELGMRKR